MKAQPYPQTRATRRVVCAMGITADPTNVACGEGSVPTLEIASNSNQVGSIALKFTSISDRCSNVRSAPERTASRPLVATSSHGASAVRQVRSTVALRSACCRRTTGNRIPNANARSRASVAPSACSCASEQHRDGGDVAWLACSACVPPPPHSQVFGSERRFPLPQERCLLGTSPSVRAWRCWYGGSGPVRCRQEERRPGPDEEDRLRQHQRAESMDIERGAREDEKRGDHAARYAVDRKGARQRMSAPPRDRPEDERHRRRDGEHARERLVQRATHHEQFARCRLLQER